MIKVTIELEYGFIDHAVVFVKEVEWPGLLPVGSGLFFEEGEGSLESRDIVQYGWHESTKKICAYTDREDCDFPIGDFVQYMAELGWRVTWERARPSSPLPVPAE